jgi:hypothetical protein
MQGHQRDDRGRHDRLLPRRNLEVVYDGDSETRSPEVFEGDIVVTGWCRPSGLSLRPTAGGTGCPSPACLRTCGRPAGATKTTRDGTRAKFVAAQPHRGELSSGDGIVLSAREVERRLA